MDDYVGIDDYESVRFKILNSKISSGLMVYDKITDKIVVDIATNNKQIDEFIVKAVFLCIHDQDFLQKVIEWECKFDDWK